MYFKLSVIACLVYVCSAADTGKTTKPTVTVLYETYCRDSIQFITQQLYPAYLTLNSSSFVPMLVPFGKATVNDTNPNNITISCQHGERECFGNKVHACVLSSDFPESLQQKLKFINCTLARTDFNNESKTYPTEECAKEFNFNATSINTCANGTHGVTLLVAFGNVSHTYNYTTVPAVVFDGVYNETVSNKSVKDFSSVLCENYFKGDTTADALCKNKNNAASTATLTVLPVIVFAFLFSKLY